MKRFIVAFTTQNTLIVEETLASNIDMAKINVFDMHSKFLSSADYRCVAMELPDNYLPN